MRVKRPDLLYGIRIIRDASTRSEDGNRCLVAPSPRLRDQIRTELARMRAAAPGPLAHLLRARSTTAPGFNDGLIYPGDLYPLGTPLRIARSGAADRSPLRGSVRVAVVLVDFSDQTMSETRQHFEELFFSTGVLLHGSVREYFKEATHNLIDIVGTVVGPYRLPRQLSEYAHGDSGTGSSAPNARTMAYDAAVKANADVDFSTYDNDGDGFVDAFIVIHAGAGAEETGDTGDIWSHKWVLAGGAYNADGTKIYAYLTVPEDAKIGVCCHELGHLLFGWPDLYDTDSSGEGVGNWCLMGGGSWNGGGDIPAHPSAWCKANQGWVSVNAPTTNGLVTMADVKAGHQIYRLWKNGASGSEYFLVENRQRTGYDQDLPGDGLLIWHVDETIDSNANENHPKVALEQADGLRGLENGDNRGDDGDPYPGATNKTAFNTSSNPNSKSYAGADTCVSVTNIGASGPSITARLGVQCVVKRKELIKDIKDKDFKDIKEKNFKDIKEKDFKDIKEKDFKDIKELKEKDFKEFKEKDWEKPAEWPGGGFVAQGAPPESGDLEARVRNLEARLSSAQPFIDPSLRPDLTRSALSEEEDLANPGRVLEGAAGEKRLYDAPR